MYGYVPFHYFNWRQSHSQGWTAAMVELNQQLRTLWEQHVFWTRLTINSIVDRLPDEQVTTARLLRNPKDFAALLEPLYGAAVASKFNQLFTEHLAIAAELVKALQAGNTAAAEDANKRWYANADALALFLSQINPYWSEQEWRRMFYEHLKLTAEEATTRLAGQYEQNVALSDPIEQQALVMADMMTHGIVRQFPALF
ncbi:acetylglutamate kinase [Paenibacillus paeoniae]|uniref:Acetylglutamate kinase n=1 Tax=Paenibacillus paeoniae TaxID=2292705 RepID=A0A371PGX8_9BACL|nr:acetylglutamate kinase [Paenibacillus paeoniae]REK74640.1 acetylglutamate kinase [Paenibacillus paeoniae]